MQRCQLEFNANFHVVAGNTASQAAVMVLMPGDATGGPQNLHSHCDQWLFVAAGRGQAIVNDQAYELSPGVLLLIERGETHEIRNAGSEPLKTVNIYVPPAYGDEPGPARD